MCHQFNVGCSWCGSHFCSYIFHLFIYITNGSCTYMTEGLRFKLFYCNENLLCSTFIQGQIPGRSCKRRSNFVRSLSVNILQSCQCWSGHIYCTVDSLAPYCTGALRKCSLVKSFQHETGFSLSYSMIESDVTERSSTSQPLELKWSLGPEKLLAGETIGVISTVTNNRHDNLEE